MFLTSALWMKVFLSERLDSLYQNSYIKYGTIKIHVSKYKNDIGTIQCEKILYATLGFNTGYFYVWLNKILSCHIYNLPRALWRVIVAHENVVLENESKLIYWASSCLESSAAYANNKSLMVAEVEINEIMCVSMNLSLGIFRCNSAFGLISQPSMHSWLARDQTYQKCAKVGQNGEYISLLNCSKQILIYFITNIFDVYGIVVDVQKLNHFKLL